MDRMACKIEIGGQISRSAINFEDELPWLDSLIGRIIGEGVQSDYGENVYNLIEKELSKFVNKDGLLEFVHESKSNGEFDDLENWLRENQIPYRRWTEPDVYNGEIVYFTPEMEVPLTVCVDVNEQEMVSGVAGRNVLELLKKHSCAYCGGPSSDELKQAIHLLEEELPVIPVIPMFKIVD